MNNDIRYIELAKACGVYGTDHLGDLLEFAYSVAADEREECAKVAEEGMLLTCKDGAFHKLGGNELTEDLDKRIGQAIAEAIRARGEK